MMNQHMVRLAFLALICPLQGVSQASAEANSPFNQFSSPSGGVDLFSGNASISHPVYTLSGRAGLDAVVQLSYSSNVAMNAKASNKVSQAGWIGLGWAMGFGRIEADHNGTKKLSDDQYVYISSQGVSQPLIRADDGTFYVKTLPFWKVLRTVSATDNSKIISWTIIDHGGTRYLHGDGAENPATLRSATEYIYSWEGTGKTANGTTYDYNAVGSGESPGASLYPHRWNLARVEDVNGNAMTYTYSQYVQKVGAQSLAYTKACYLNKITSPDGARLEFVLEDKKVEEYWDPFRAKEEDATGGLFVPGGDMSAYAFSGDSYMEFLETKLLQKILAFSSNGEPLRQFEFCRKQINGSSSRDVKDDEALIDGNYTKSLLTKITEKQETLVVGEHVFEYYDVNPDDGETNYGALKSMRAPGCGKISYEYKKHPLNEAHRLTFDPDPDLTLPLTLTFGQGFDLKTSSLRSGAQFFGVLGKDKNAKDKIWIYNWNGEANNAYPRKVDPVTLAKKSYLPPQDVWIDGTSSVSGYAFLGTALDLKMEVGDEAIAFYNGTTLWILEWKNGRWQNSAIWGWTANARIDNLSFSGETLALEQILGYVSQVVAFRKVNGVWQEKAAQSAPFEDASCGYVDIGRINASSGYILVEWNGNRKSPCKQVEPILAGRHYQVSTWMGDDWKTTLKRTNVTKASYMLPINDGQIAFYDEHSNDEYISTIRWSGSEWLWTPERAIPSWHARDVYKPRVVGVGDDYFLLRYDQNEHLKAFNWTGTKWDVGEIGDYESSYLFASSEEDINAYAGPDYFGVTHLDTERDRKKICVPFTSLCRWVTIFTHVYDNAKVDMWRKKDGEWAPSALFRGKHDFRNLSPKKVLPGDDNFVIANTSGSVSGFGGAYIWNGSKFVSEPGPFEGSATVTSLDGRTLLHDNFSKVKTIYRKYQNNYFKNFYVYMVHKKIVTDPIANSTPSEFIYSYDLDDPQSRARSSLTTGTVFNAKTTVQLPDGNGKIVTYFHNQNQAEDAPLIGMVRKQETYSQSSSRPIAVVENEYSLQRDPAWPGDVYQLQTPKVKTTTKGMVIEESSQFNPGNGMPSSHTVVNSDGTVKTTVSRYAFEFDLPGDAEDVYQKMKERNMLSQVAQSLVYIGETVPANVTLATATTYALSPTGFSNPAPTAHESYTHLDRDGTGYHDFIFANPPGNSATNWKLTGRLTRVNAFGYVQESQVADLSTEATLHRSKSYPIAIVKGAAYQNVAAFTADYDEHPGDAGGNFDDANGWSKGGASLNENLKDFGEAAVFIPAGAQGPGKSLSLTDSRDFVFSCWAYSAGANTPVRFMVNATAFTANLPVANKWTFLQVRVPHATATGNVAIRLAPSGIGFYANDIRFHPYGAAMKTLFYSANMQNILTTVSPTNIPSFKVFDALDRETETWALNTDGEKVLLSEREYHMNGCRLKALVSGLASLDLWDNLNNEKIEFGFSEATASYDIYLQTMTSEVLLESVLNDPDAPIELRVEGQVVSDACVNQCSFTIPVVDANSDQKVEVVVSAGTMTYTLNLRPLQFCWTPHQLRGVSENYAGNPSVALKNNAIPYVAYSDRGKDELGIVRFWDNGLSSWKDEGVEFSAGKAENIQLKFDTDGNPMVAFLDETVVDNVYVKKAYVKRSFGDWQLIGGAALPNPDVKALSFEHYDQNGPDLGGQHYYAAYIGDAAGAVATTDLRLVSANYLPVSNQLELTFNQPVNDATFSPGTAVSLSLASQPSGAVNFDNPLAFTTGNAAGDKTLFLTLGEQDALVLEAFEPGLLTNELKLALGAALIRNNSGTASAAIAVGDNFWVSYDRSAAPAPKQYGVFVTLSTGSSWMPVGPPIGLVNPVDAKSISLAVSQSGTPYVAYIGKISYTCGDPAQPGNLSCPDGHTKTTVEAYTLVVSKYIAGAWVPVSSQPLRNDINGDIIPTSGALNVKLVVDGETPYVAFDHPYFVTTNEATGAFDLPDLKAVSVRRFDPAVTAFDGTNWVPVTDPVTGTLEEEDTYVAFMQKSSQDFDFKVRNGHPYLSFVSQYDENKVTVIKHAGTKWASVGNPAFIAGRTSPVASSVSLAVTTGATPDLYLAAVEGSKKYSGKVSILEYCDDCKDATFSAISIKRTADNSDVPLSWDFRQYFLRYYGTVPYANALHDISISPVPQTCTDIEKVSITVNGSPVLMEPPPDWCDGPHAFNVKLEVGTNEIRVRGVAEDDHNWVEYVFTLEKEPNPDPSHLAFEFFMPDDRPLAYSPAFSRSLAGPYAIEGGVNAATAQIYIRPEFSAGAELSIAGKPMSSGLKFPVDLQVGNNEIVVEVKVGASLSTHTFTVQRMGDIVIPPLPLHAVAVLAPVSDFSSVYTTIVDAGREYTVKVDGAVTQIWIKRADGNTNTVTVNGIPLSGSVPIAVPLPSGNSRISIIESDGPSYLKDYLVDIIRDNGMNAIARVYVGVPQRNPVSNTVEPAGFFTYPNLNIAYAALKADVEGSSTPGQLPSSYEVYVFPGFGADEVEPDPDEFNTLVGRDLLQRSMMFLGIIKGTPLYQQLLDEYNSSL